MATAQLLVAAGAAIDATSKVSPCVSSDTDIAVLLNKAVLMKHNNHYLKCLTHTLLATCNNFTEF